MAKKLGDILDGLETGMGRSIQICSLLSLWEKVVDERVGKHTEAIKIRNGILYVSASSPAWAQELTFLKRDIIKKFNLQAGKEVINDIKFKSGG
ncbi:MAG: DUF721 domain-containing protein [Candidatus Margulisiibacteriota bacterium]